MTITTSTNGVTLASTCITTPRLQQSIMAHPSLRSSARVEDDVRRFACDRCRSHKLRCERQLLPGVPRKTIPCSRCIKQGHHCATTPQYRNGRERHGSQGKIRRQLGQQSTTPFEPGFEDSAESDEHDADSNMAQEVDMDDYSSADDNIMKSTVAHNGNGSTVLGGIVRENTARSTPQEFSAGSRKSVSHQAQTDNFPPIDPQLYSPYSFSMHGQESDMDRMLQDCSTSGDQTNPRRDDTSYFADIDFGLGDAGQADHLQTDADNIWYSGQQPAETACMQTPAASVKSSSASKSAANGIVSGRSLSRRLTDMTASLYKTLVQGYDPQDGQRNNTYNSSICGLQDKVEDYILLLEAIASNRQSEVARLEDVTPRPGDKYRSDHRDSSTERPDAEASPQHGSGDIDSRLDRLSLFTAIAASYQNLLQAYHQIFSKISNSLASGGQSGQTELAMLPRFQMVGTKSVMTSSLQAHMTIEMANHTLNRIECELRLIITAYQTETDEMQMIALALLSALIYTEGDPPANPSAAVRDTIRGIGRGLGLYS